MPFPQHRSERGPGFDPCVAHPNCRIRLRGYNGGRGTQGDRKHLIVPSLGVHTYYHQEYSTYPLSSKYAKSQGPIFTKSNTRHHIYFPAFSVTLFDQRGSNDMPRLANADGAIVKATWRIEAVNNLLLGTCWQSRPSKCHGQAGPRGWQGPDVDCRQRSAFPAHPGCGQ